MHRAPRSRATFPSGLFPTFHNQFIGKTAALKLSEVLVQTTLHGCSLFHHQAFCLNSGDEGIARLESQRPSNGSRNQQPALRT